ncbi:unnamed protein product [Caenorhabditis angaria]|uniref:Uncharacterized protein n=1 Tax=Caenorhabditis angaria TaxID=860376 RepID=A0A9P1MWA6_9PELO|nr:unnamed protein product [Caenorhabditis angaria]
MMIACSNLGIQRTCLKIAMSVDLNWDYICTVFIPCNRNTKVFNTIINEVMPVLERLLNIRGKATNRSIQHFLASTAFAVTLFTNVQHQNRWSPRFKPKSDIFQYLYKTTLRSICSKNPSSKPNIKMYKACEMGQVNSIFKPKSDIFTCTKQLFDQFAQKIHLPTEYQNVQGVRNGTEVSILRSLEGKGRIMK